MTVVFGGSPNRRVRMGRSRRGRGCAVGVFLFGLVMVIPFVAVLTVVWPGVLKLTAPLVCADGFDDAVVARDTYSSGPGETSTNFTLYCMNERGEVSDEGGFRPGVLVFAACAVLYVALVLLLVVIARLRRGGRGRPDADTSPPGPTGPTGPPFGEQSWMPGQPAPPFGTILPAPGAPPVPPAPVPPVPPRSSPIPPPPST